MNKRCAFDHRWVTGGCLYIFLLLLFVVSCNTRQTAGKAASDDSAEYQVVPPNQSIAKMKLEDVLKIRLIPSEPLVSTPVAMI